MVPCTRRASCRRRDDLRSTYGRAVGARIDWAHQTLVALHRWLYEWWKPEITHENWPNVRGSWRSSCVVPSAGIRLQRCPAKHHVAMFFVARASWPLSSTRRSVHRAVHQWHRIACSRVKHSRVSLTLRILLRRSPLRSSRVAARPLPRQCLRCSRQRRARRAARRQHQDQVTWADPVVRPAASSRPSTPDRACQRRCGHLVNVQHRNVCSRN